MNKNDFLKAAELYKGKALAHGDEDQYDKVEWVCSRKHRFTASLFNVKSGIWCRKCQKEDEKEEVVNGIHELAAYYGGECLTKERFSMTSSIKLKCNQGHTWHSHPNAILKGSWCKLCEKALFNEERFEKIKIIVREKGGKINSGTPQNTTSKIDIDCANGHKFKIMANTILMGSWCQLCGYKRVSDLKKFPLSFYQEIAEKKGGKVLTTLKQYETAWPNLEFQCANKHTWITSVDNIRAGHWCPKWECHYDPSKYVHDRIGFDEYVKAAKVHGGKLVSPKKDFVNSTSLLTWQCKNGHEFQLPAGLVRTSGRWCIECGVQNKKDSVFQQYKKWAVSNGFKILSKSVTGYFSDEKFDWQCSKGHTWSATANHMKAKNYCSQCLSEETKQTYLQDIQKIALSKGGKCVSEKYLNNFTHLEFRCKNGHTFFSNGNNVKTGYWCSQCAGNARKDIQSLKKIATKRGGKLISTKYEVYGAPLTWECKEGHIFQLNVSKASKNRWCPVCYKGGIIPTALPGQKHLYSIEDMQKLAKENGGICLSRKYLGTGTKLKWQCSEGHKWEAKPVKIKAGSWCRICRYEQNAKARRLPLSDIVKIVAEKEGKILSSEKSYELSHPLVKLKCIEGHVWETNIKYVKAGSWCPDCMYDTMSLNTRFPFSHYQKLVSRKGGKLLTAEADYQNSRGKLTIKCKKGHVFEKVAGQLNEGSWCVECG